MNTDEDWEQNRKMLKREMDLLFNGIIFLGVSIFFICLIMIFS